MAERSVANHHIREPPSQSDLSLQGVPACSGNVGPAYA